MFVGDSTTVGVSACVGVGISIGRVVGVRTGEGGVGE